MSGWGNRIAARLEAWRSRICGICDVVLRLVGPIKTSNDKVKRQRQTPALTTMQQDNSKQSLHRLDHGALVESCQRSWEGNVIMRTR